MVTKFIDDHTCPIVENMLSQLHAISLTIAKIVKHNFLNLKSTYTPAEIMEEMRNLYGIRMNYKKAYRAKEKYLNWSEVPYMNLMLNCQLTYTW